MINLKPVLLTIPMLLAATSTQAVVIDFIKLIEVDGYGESAWTTLTAPEFTVDITGTASDDTPFGDTQQYAYLDWGTAGLGVCKDLGSSATADQKYPGSGSNLCNPSSDDNITTNEALR